MSLSVVKRDGSIVEFDKSKIVNAILKAMKYGDGINTDIAYMIANEIEEMELKTVHTIETTVFHKLIKYGQDETARKYESYRSKREFARQTNSTDHEILTLVNGTNADALEENSNKKADTAATQRDLIAGEVSKDIFRRRIMPTHLLQAHDEGIFHWHDADYSIQSIHNCDLVNLEDMLLNGTVINDKLVESPNSFLTACTVATQIMAQVASSQYGGQSIALKHLAPFIERSYRRYHDMLLNVISEPAELKAAINVLLEKEIRAGIQTIRYQLSTLQTTNGMR